MRGALLRSRTAALLLAAAASAGIAQEAPPPAAADPMFVVGAPAGPPLEGKALEDRTEEVASLLRCPVCQGLSVADSPANMAQNMKAEARGLVAKGYSEEQILAYFERSYGEFVRLRPPLRGVNWLVWLGPLLGLLAGGAFVAFVLRRNAAAAPLPAPSDLPGRDTLPDDPRLAAAVRRVRELAYGWPGGRAEGAP